MKINKYPDRTSYCELISNDPKGNYTYRVNNYEDLWHLNQLVDAHNNYFGEKPTVTLPNLIDAQADRRFGRNQSSGLKLVCQFLNGMNANFKVFHPHNSEVVEAVMNNVEIIDNKSFINKVLLHTDTLGKEDNLILMSSDAGGFKPLMGLCDQINWKGETASCNKYRYYENGNTILKQGVPRPDFNGKDILIVDDISVYGGTFKGLSKLLRDRYCGKLYLAVSHMTVQNLGEDPVTNYFDKVFTSNSKYDRYWFDPHQGATKAGLIQPDNLEIIKMF